MTLLFIQAAHAAGEVTGPSAFVNLALPLLFVAVFYFMLIRPQSKRNKEHKNMVANLNTGDEVVFAGGLMGSIDAIDGEYAVVSLNSNNHIKIQKAAVISVLPKGTIENLG